MNTPTGSQGAVGCTKALFCVTFFCCLGAANLMAGDLMSTICRNAVVSVGDRTGVVLAKCGPPLSKSQETLNRRVLQTLRKKKPGKKQTEKDTIVTTKRKTVKERAETWTYNIDGSYRFFIFKEGKLASIETGGLAN